MDKILRNENTNLKLEIERLKEEIKGYKQERERVLNIIDERNHKAIEYIEDYLCSYDYTSAKLKDIANVFMGLLDTLQGVDKE